MASTTSKGKTKTSTSRTRKPRAVKPVVVETPKVEEPVVEETPKQTAADRKVEARREFVMTGDKLAFVRSNARPAETTCLCGCGSPTKGRFSPGHDALLKRSLSCTIELGTPEDAAVAKEAQEIFGW